MVVDGGRLCWFGTILPWLAGLAVEGYIGSPAAPRKLGVSQGLKSRSHWLALLPEDQCSQPLSSRCFEAAPHNCHPWRAPGGEADVASLFFHPCLPGGGTRLPAFPGPSKLRAVAFSAIEGAGFKPCLLPWPLFAFDICSNSQRGFPEPGKNDSLVTNGGKKTDNSQQSMEQEKEVFG